MNWETRADLNSGTRFFNSWGEGASMKVVTVDVNQLTTGGPKKFKIGFKPCWNHKPSYFVTDRCSIDL